MTHDPFCPKSVSEFNEYCECTLIARVRRDEVERVMDNVITTINRMFVREYPDIQVKD
jgi:hypothetical protein